MLLLTLNSTFLVDIDIAGSVFKNGYAGIVRNAQLYVSENLQGEVNLVVDVATADEVVTIFGVTFTAKATPAVAGEFDVAGSVDAQGAIMANMINGAATGKDSATGYFKYLLRTDRFLQTRRLLLPTQMQQTRLRLLRQDVLFTRIQCQVQ